MQKAQANALAVAVTEEIEQRSYANARLIAVDCVKEEFVITELNRRANKICKAERTRKNNRKEKTYENQKIDIWNYAAACNLITSGILFAGYNTGRYRFNRSGYNTSTGNQ